MSRTVRTPVSSDALKPLRTKVQTLRRQVPAMADEEVWRSFLRLTTSGTASTRAMTEGQLRQVVEALHKAGAPRVSSRRAGGTKPRFAPSSQLGKIRALWITLADAGVIRDRSDAALEAFVRNRAGQDIGVLDATGAGRAIEALKAMARRQGVALET